MGKKYRNLIDKVLSYDNFLEAYKQASRGKRKTFSYLHFKEQYAAHLIELIESIKNKTYQPRETMQFYVYEPKKRLITAPDFFDRVVQHALVNVINPIFEATMLPNSYACRVGKGTHKGVTDLQAELRRMNKKHEQVYALKTDFSGYFYNISREVLWGLIEKKISCRHTLWLIEQFLPKRGYGLPIGHLTSQLFANVYGTQVDRYLAQHLKVKCFYRYMDDIVILHWSKAYLEMVREFLEWYCEYTLRLFFSKWSIQNAKCGINFLGYRTFEKYKLIRRDSVIRAKRKLAKYTRLGDTEKLERFKASFKGHVQWADSHNLITKLKLGDSQCL